MVENSRIANVRQTPQMLVLERLVHRAINIAVPRPNLINLQPGRGLRQLVELLRQILPLLRRALRRRGKRGQLAVNLLQEFAQLAKVEGAALVGVVLLKEAIQSPQVVARLRELLLHVLGDLLPIFEGDVHGFWVAAVFGGEALEEGDDAVGDVVLHGGAVADGVDGGLGGAKEAEVGIRGEGVLVVLIGKFGGEAFAEGCLGFCMVSRVDERQEREVAQRISCHRMALHVCQYAGNIKAGMKYVQTPVDHRQNPMGSSLVTVSPLASFCVKRILSSLTSLTRAFVITST